MSAGHSYFVMLSTETLSRQNIDAAFLGDSFAFGILWHKY